MQLKQHRTLRILCAESGTGAHGHFCGPGPCSDSHQAVWPRVLTALTFGRFRIVSSQRRLRPLPTWWGAPAGPWVRHGALRGPRRSPAAALLRPDPWRRGSPSPGPAGLRVGPTSSRTGCVLCPAPGAGRAGRAEPPASIFWAVLCSAAAGLRVRKHHGPPGKRAGGWGAEPRKCPLQGLHGAGGGARRGLRAWGPGRRQPDCTSLLEGAGKPSWGNPRKGWASKTQQSRAARGEEAPAGARTPGPAPGAERSGAGRGGFGWRVRAGCAASRGPTARLC